MLQLYIFKNAQYIQSPMQLFSLVCLLLTTCFGLNITVPEIEISSIDWAQLSRFYLKTETASSLRTLCFAEAGVSSIDWDQLSRFYLKTETESSLRNIVF
jgi:hypothetical protein